MFALVRWIIVSAEDAMICAEDVTERFAIAEFPVALFGKIYCLFFRVGARNLNDLKKRIDNFIRQICCAHNWGCGVISFYEQRETCFVNIRFSLSQGKFCQLIFVICIKMGFVSGFFAL